MKRFISAFDREEKGLPPLMMNQPPLQGQNGGASGAATESQVGPSSSGFSGMTRAPIGESSLIPTNDKLLMFRALTGIDGVPALTTHGFFHQRTAPNVGIYARVLRYEKVSGFRYRVFSVLINTCLGIQIVVAAALTAIGAANGPHGVVTAFGAINTIMAGILTYLKASGLPKKEKDLQHEWTKIREYMEQREREFCLQGCQLDVEEEIATVERMYEEAKEKVGLNGREFGVHDRDRELRRERRRSSFGPGPTKGSSVETPAPAHVRGEEKRRSTSNLFESKEEH